MDVHPQRSLEATPSAALLLLMASAVLAGFGIVMLFFGATFLQDARLLAEVPEALWALLCGLPLSEAMVAPVLFVAGSVAVLLALGVIVTRGFRWTFAMLLLGGAAFSALAGYVLGESNRTSIGASPTVMWVEPPRPMPDFTLLNQHGFPMRLSDFHGKVVVLFFGYTNCPDVCPLSMSDMRRLKIALGQDASQVAFVFISVDGERDTPEVLRRYVKVFDPDFYGLTGDERTIRQVALEYGAKFRLNKAQSADPNRYTVDHTAYTYVLDAAGCWRAMWGLSTPPEDAAQVVRTLLRERR
ncbi:MAG: SCO family protein [Thermoflexales bacterium]